MINFSCLYTKFPPVLYRWETVLGSIALIVRYCFEQTDGLIDLLFVVLDVQVRPDSEEIASSSKCRRSRSRRSIEA